MPKEKSRRRSSRSSHGRQRRNRSRTARAEPSVTVDNQEEHVPLQDVYPQSLNPMALVLLGVIFFYIDENFLELDGNEAPRIDQSHVATEPAAVAEDSDSSFFVLYWYLFYFPVVFYQE